MVGEDASKNRVRNCRRAYIVRRRIGVRQVGEGGSGHAKTPLLCWFQERASCQRAARRATVATMPDENFLSQVPAASALFLREEEVRKTKKAVRKVAKKRSEEHTSELKSLMRNSYAVFCLKKKRQETIRCNTDKNNKSRRS